jgi:hypothetical protein
MIMDNKYGLGGAKVAHAHHETKLKSSSTSTQACHSCRHDRLIYCPTLSDHYCVKCGNIRMTFQRGILQATVPIISDGKVVSLAEK